MERTIGTDTDLVVAVVPCHNERDSVLRCLTHLAEGHQGVRTILVDDGSTDGTSIAVKAAHPDVVVINGDGNLWWTGAVNLGIERARQMNATHVLLLNNDTTVQPGGIGVMHASSKTAGDAIVGAAVARSFVDGAELFGGVFNYRGLDYHREPQTLDSHGLSDATWLPGHALIVPIAVFDVIGLPDSLRFPHYWGDVDFTIKAAKAGIRLALNPAVVAQNDGSHTGIGLGTTVRPRHLWLLLTSQRSTLRLSDNVRFWRAHRDLLTWKQLLRRYELIPIIAGQEVLDRIGLRNSIRRLREQNRDPKHPAMNGYDSGGGRNETESAQINASTSRRRAQ
jgi:GT2 family glycosyltransferase